MENQILKSDAEWEENNSETTLRQTLTEDRVLADLDRLNIITQKDFKSGIIFIFVIIVICVLLKLFFPVALPLGILFLVTLVLWMITFIRQNQKYATIKANGLPLQIYTYYCHDKYKASGSDSDDYYIWLSTSPDYPAKKIECEESTFYSFEAGGFFYYIYRSEKGEIPAVYSCEQYELDSVLQKYIK